MKISQFMLCLNAGGAERVAVRLAHDWISRDHEVEIITLTGDDWSPRYELDPRIRHVELDLFGDSANFLEGVVNNLGRVRALRRVLRESQPDIVVAQLTREIAIAVLATRGLGIPVIGHHHSNPESLDDHLIWRHLVGWAFDTADRMVFLTDETLQRFPPSIQDHSVAIPNPVEPPPPPPASFDVELPRPAVVCVTGLRAVKDHGTLVRAFATLADRFPEWTLVIVGEGEERPRIEGVIDELDMKDRVEMTGFIPDQYEALHQADVFALPSRWEGFSMALCEAMACGVPVVTTDSSGGQRLIVRDGIDGLLVPPGDPEALADALERLMADPDGRERIGKRAAEVVDRFGRDSVFDRWRSLLAEVAEDKV